ncbi:PREDICTED: putative nuclease HARBI1 [Bactrocera latifrons]|uniref:putative nuclease HARBI1 n=1 Tax=Bactrocera latifrons TaxID=174628 RepID=UPI0008DCE84B|nr:PREDICTED: putative nuclease HARBI1 [Bactrocera latifrons]
MSRETFAELKSALEPFWITLRREYSMDQALHITLWKLSNSRVTYRELSDKFDVSKGTVHKIFLKTINAIFGCLDGTHFKINTPKKDAISYCDRKGNYSIIMQGICDSTFRFLDVFIGYPGSCHDANVWKNSPIYKGITSGEIQLAKDAIILTDSAYPLSKYLIAPYRDNGHLLREEKQFNYYLSSTRVFIEQAFGI